MLSRIVASRSMAGQTPVTATSLGTTTTGAGPTTTITTAPSAALTPIEIQQIISKVQASATQKLSPAQISSLRTALANPSQQLVAPGTVWSPVSSTMMQSNGTAFIRLSGGYIQIDPKGVVVSQVSNANPMAGLPRVSLWACLSFFDGVASFALAVLLLLAGIAALRHSRRSLRMHQIYGWAKLPLAILGSITYCWVLTDFMTGMPGTAMGNTRMLFGMYSGFLAALSIAYPIGLLIALRSRIVRGYSTRSASKSSGAASLASHFEAQIDAHGATMMPCPSQPPSRLSRTN